jgi:hypothetical protein
MTSKKTNIRKNKEKVALMSHRGEFPQYNANDYARQLISANRKYDRLFRFMISEADAVLAEKDDDLINWEVEMKKRAKALQRWQRDITAVLRDLLKMLQDVRHDETLLEFYLDDASDNLRQKAKK